MNVFGYFGINIAAKFVSIIADKAQFKGAVFYTQERVGRNNRHFNMIKFRSMKMNAEEYGPEWAGEKDPRITWVGRIIRKIYFDEVPQLLNVLKMK